MCKTNTKGIDHVIPVMLDTKGNAMFGPLHGPWQNEHVQHARQHLSYILINSRNYASGKDQIQAAWEAKFSASNLREYGDSSQSGHAMELDPSHETESQHADTPEKDIEADSQYVWDDEDDGAVRTHEEKDAETHELEMDNVFLSLVQDFGKKRLKESWVAVGNVLKTYAHPRRAPLGRPPLETQFIVVLKGIGVDTYKCLQDRDSRTSNQVRNETRRYLRELTSGRVEYVDKNAKLKCRAAMQNIPLVYGDSMLGSEKWDTLRPLLQAGWEAEQ